MARFLIRRLDQPGSSDNVALESEGLTIGRSAGNDLVLNNRSVSRTHAGIKEMEGEFWLFNLSASNGTFLNGSPADKIPLADGDVVQVGPYYLQLQYVQKTLSITVRMEFEVKAVAARSAESGSMMAGIPAPTTPKKKGMTIGGSRRPEGTGFMTSMVPPPDEEALRIFWEKRKREAGKIGIKTPLRPKRIRGFGKTQFNWRPTNDLRKPWPMAFFVWGAIVVVSIALILLLAYRDGYSPATLSSAHLTANTAPPQFARQRNAGACSNCHGVLHAMQTHCASCHTTKAFDPSLSNAHERAGIGCAGCHGEHQGREFKPGLVDSGACISCHNNRYRFNGRILGIPHGGTVGYPVKDGKWQVAQISRATWQRKLLPDNPELFQPIEQFHLVHLSGVKEGRLYCKDCHATATHSDPKFRSAPRESCDRCHSARAASLAGPECVSCHEQHGKSKNLIASLRRAEPQIVQARYENMENPGIGGASALRQNRASLTLASLLFRIGGVRWSYWLGLVFSLCLFGYVTVLRDRRSHTRTIAQSASAKKPPKERGRTIDLELIQREGPAYPHPVVDPVLCIGCHACVEACPHDVLAIVGGVSVPVAPDQCMEDTGCEAECPVSPKACVVVNTKKVIPPRKVPRRDTSFMTNVEGIYLIGDVSGVPLIKNAVNEGAQVIETVAESLKSASGQADYDVAIIGIGPGGLSAAVLAKQKGMKIVAIEQEMIAATIQNYPAGKYVFYKPDSVKDKGGIPVPGPGGQKEDLLNSWMEVIRRNNLKINEDETCKSVKKEEGFFRVVTEKNKTKETVEYTARTVVLGIGNRGAPMKLGAAGEDKTFTVSPTFACPGCGDPRAPQRPFCTTCGNRFTPKAQPPLGYCTECGLERAQETSCSRCGAPGEEKTPLDSRFGTMEFTPDMLKDLEAASKKKEQRRCLECGSPYQDKHRFCGVCGERILRLPQQPFEDSRVKYKLSDPDDYVGKKCIVVGGGNSAIEAAVDLCGFKRIGDQFIFVRDNEVTLLVRSDFKGDLKLGNKINIYDCIDAGKVKVLFGAAIKEIIEGETVIINVRSKQEIARLKNDYIFALIGGEKPTKFLEQIGVKIG